MGHLSGLLSRHGLLEEQFLLACHYEVGEAADVLGQATTGEFDDAVGNGVDEVPIVAHEQEAPRPGGQVLLQPGHAVHVQVVGGLVHDEQVRGREQQAGEGHPHAPASRHLVHGPTVVRRVESQSGEDPVGVGLHGVPADLLEAGLGFAEVVQGPNLVGPGGLADPDSQGLDLVGQFRDGTGTQHHLLEYRPTGLGR